MTWNVCGDQASCKWKYHGTHRKYTVRYPKCSTELLVARRPNGGHSPLNTEPQLKYDEANTVEVKGEPDEETEQSGFENVTRRLHHHCFHEVVHLERAGDYNQSQFFYVPVAFCSEETIKKIKLSGFFKENKYGIPHWSEESYCLLKIQAFCVFLEYIMFRWVM